MMMPPAVLVSSLTRRTTTRSPRGRNFMRASPKELISLKENRHGSTLTLRVPSHDRVFRRGPAKGQAEAAPLFREILRRKAWPECGGFRAFAKHAQTAKG